jgi:hypothetical protein
MNLQDEAWTAIPDLEGYEVSTLGRVRSFRVKGKGDTLAAEPHVLKPMHWKGEQHYSINGEKWTIDALMRAAYGLEDDWDEDIDFETEAHNRELTTYEVNEIVMLEGVKPAHEAAEEFRITHERVRNVWDGLER